MKINKDSPEYKELYSEIYAKELASYNEAKEMLARGEGDDNHTYIDDSYNDIILEFDSNEVEIDTLIEKLVEFRNKLNNNVKLDVYCDGLEFRHTIKKLELSSIDDVAYHTENEVYSILQERACIESIRSDIVNAIHHLLSNKSYDTYVYSVCGDSIIKRELQYKREPFIFIRSGNCYMCLDYIRNDVNFDIISKLLIEFGMISEYDEELKPKNSMSVRNKWIQIDLKKLKAIK